MVFETDSAASSARLGLLPTIFALRFNPSQPSRVVLTAAQRLNWATVCAHGVVGPYPRSQASPTLNPYRNRLHWPDFSPPPTIAFLAT